MALDLNDIIEPYKDFYGRVTEQMPLLIAEDRIPLSVAGFMEGRLNSTKPAWKDYYFFTGDLIAYHPDKKFKIVLDDVNLRKLHAQTQLTPDHALPLEEGLYETLEGEEFLYKDVKKFLDKELSQKEVLQHPVWKAVARNPALLETYVPQMFSEIKQRFNYDENMGMYLDSFDKVPKARALVLWLGGRSRLMGGSFLGNDYGRLVGVAPEALNAHGKVLVKPSLETALNVVNEHMGKSGIILRAQ